MNSLDHFARDKLAALEARKLRRRLAQGDHAPGLIVTRDGRALVDFCSNDYLGLAHDPAVKQAAARALEKYGAGAHASRLVTGNYALLDELEVKLAVIKGAEAACVFGSGYLANLGIVPSLMAGGDLILADELSHTCILAGTKLSGAKSLLFRHNDMDDLKRLLSEHRVAARHAMILTDGVFSMDGDLAPLPEIMTLAREHDAWVLTDDAHGLGVVGEGRGSAAHWRVKPDLQMGTLSKAAGAYGGYVCGSHMVIDLLKTRARTLIYSTALPPAAAGAALKALGIIETDFARVASPLRKARAFAKLLGLPEPQSAIVPIVIGAPEAALEASAKLEEAGFLVTAIRPPTVPEGTARLRLTFSAAHRDEDIARLAEAIRALRILQRAA